MRTGHKIAFASLIVFVLISCRFLPSRVPATETSVTPQSISTATDVPTREVIDTPVVTEAVPTATSAPATELTPNGPYILYAKESGIWLSNADGTVLTKISSQTPGLGDLHSALSPSGKRLVFVSQNESGLDLLEVMIPSGETRILTHLMDITPDELISDPTSKKAFAYYAIHDYPAVAWKPGSDDLLAFSGAIDGPTSDLYLYDFTTNAVVRLTDGGSQTIYPSWSPDGNYILHYGVSWVPPFGGAIVGFNRFDGIWAVEMSTRKVIQQPKPQVDLPLTLGWQYAGENRHSYFAYDNQDICGSQNLRVVDALTGKSEAVMQESFYVISQNPTSSRFLFSASADCKNSPGLGVYLYSPDGGQLEKLSDAKAYEISWQPEGGAFYAYPLGLFSEDGVNYPPPFVDKSYHPALSKLGYQAWEVIENRQGRTILSTDGKTWQDVLPGLVDGLLWDPVKGDTLMIALADGSLYRASSPQFEPLYAGSLEGHGLTQMIWVP